MKRANVLVTGAGGIVGQGIVKCLNLAEAKKRPSLFYNIIGADPSFLAASLYLVEKGTIVPKADYPGYIQSIIDVIKRNDIQAVYIGTDPELTIISKYQRDIEQQTVTRIMSSPAEVIEIARDKWKTINFLINNGFPCPDSVLPDNLKRFLNTHDFPLLVKPREGFGSTV